MQKDPSKYKKKNIKGCTMSQIPHMLTSLTIKGISDEGKNFH